MARATPDILRDAIFPPLTVQDFRGPDKEKRLNAGETLLRVALIYHEDNVLTKLGYPERERPFVTAIIGAVNYSHSSSTERGWEYRNRQDIRRNRAVVYLNSPLPGVVGLVGHAGKELSAEEARALDSILPNSGSAEVARIYILDRAFWNKEKMVKALTAEMKKPTFGIHSTDQRGGELLRIARGMGLMGLGSAQIEDEYTMKVDLDIPGNPKTHQRLKYLTEIPGAAIMVGVERHTLR